VLIGWIRPVILLPLAVATGFPAPQVELILAHELAHLRRWDPLVNLFQVVLETVHFYHPVVRWISRDVRNEREICCDRLALTLGGGSRREFVAMLAELGELRMQRETLLLAVGGGMLLDRVQQMMIPPAQHVSQARKSGHAVATLFSAILVAATLQLQWTQAQLRLGMEASTKQWRELVTGVRLPSVAAVAVAHIADLAPLRLGSIHLLSVPLAASVLPPVSSLGAVALPHTSSWQVSDLKPGRPSSLVLDVDRALPASAAALPAPVPIHVRQPVYPMDALRRGIEGQVVVEFSLTGDGEVTDLRMISATPAGIFDQAALDAMRGWRYDLTRASSGGRRYRQTMAFTLNAAHAGAIAGRNIHARANCQIATGTRICRWPDHAGSQTGTSAVRGRSSSW